MIEAPTTAPAAPRLRPGFRFAPWHLAGLLIAAAFAAYAPALDGEPLWDDSFLVGDNPFFRSPLFVLEAFRNWLFPDSLSVYYRPVQNLSYMADYVLWRGIPFGYHLSNIHFHAIAACFLFALLRRILPAFRSEGESWPVTGIAFGVALLWTVHPIHNAGVAYIAGRADSLAALFALGGWLLFLRGCEKSAARKALFFCGAWLAGLLALCSKEIALTWMALFAAIELAPAGWGIASPSTGRKPNRWAIAGGLLSVLTAYWILHHLPPPRMPAAGEQASPFGERVLLMFRALGDYTGLMFCPGRLQMCRTVFTPGAYANVSAWHRNIGGEYLSLLGAATLAGILFGMRSSAPGRGPRLLGGAWFLGGFLPISNLFPLNAQVAEHWIYMPSIGALVFLAGCALALPVWGRRAALVAALCGVVGFTVRTRLRSEEWTSAERLYRATLESGSADPRILVNLALDASHAGKPERAEQMLRALVAARPDYIPARLPLGHLLLASGRTAEAGAMLKSAGEDKNAGKFAKTWTAQLGLARIRAAAGHPEEAMALLDEALAKNPEVEMVLLAKIHLLQKTGRTAEALVLARARCSKAWWDVPARAMLAQLLLATGKLDEALEVLRLNAWLDIWADQPLLEAAKLELSRGHSEAALPYLRRAAWRNPVPSRYEFMAAILRNLHRDTEAADAFHRALELRRENPALEKPVKP